jgi:hypothetical protein
VVLAYRSRTKIFDFLYDDETALQELTGGPNSVTEITHLPTENCCLVFQTISPLGATELYTIEYDESKKLRVYRFFRHGLPSFVERSTFGYCNNNDLILSYTIHNYQSENSIFHLRCNRERDRRRYLGLEENSRYNSYQSQMFSGNRYPSSYYQDRRLNRTVNYLHPPSQPYQTQENVYAAALSRPQTYIPANIVYEEPSNSSLVQNQQRPPMYSQNRTAPYVPPFEDRYVLNGNRSAPYMAPPNANYQNQPIKPLYNQPMYNQQPPMPYPQQPQQPQQPPMGGYPIQYQGGK